MTETIEKNWNQQVIDLLTQIASGSSGGGMTEQQVEALIQAAMDGVNPLKVLTFDYGSSLPPAGVVIDPQGAMDTIVYCNWSNPSMAAAPPAIAEPTKAYQRLRIHWGIKVGYVAGVAPALLSVSAYNIVQEALSVSQGTDYNGSAMKMLSYTAGAGNPSSAYCDMLAIPGGVRQGWNVPAKPLTWVVVSRWNVSNGAAIPSQPGPS
jgi:hypothetical protein